MEQWLREERVIPDNVKLQAWLALGFLGICILNTVGLLLAKHLRRTPELAVRRALGATRVAIFAQLLTEGGIVGLVGGAAGFALTELGLWGLRQQATQYADLVNIDLSMFALTFSVALIAGVFAGVLPAWRGCVISPASILKVA